MKQTIISKITSLRDSLQKTNNNTSSFFNDIKVKIEGSKSDKELKDILESLRSIGSITQYGNFDHSQDLLLEDLLKEIKLALEKLS